MTDLAVIEHEEQGGFLNLFGGASPVAVVHQTAEIADALADVINKRQLYAVIQQKKHVTVEGWTLLGTMLGVYPVCVWTKQIRNETGQPWGWEARVEARTRDGAVVGAAEAQCLRDEAPWSFNPPKGKPRDDYALRSMAQTRATSKALRQPLGFVVKLAGYQSTPAEEIPGA